MHLKNKKILITGLFVSTRNKDIIYRTAADQLAEVLIENKFSLIKTSYQVNKFLRAIDIMLTILFKSFFYKIAIVPFYGSANAFIIENWSTKLLRLLNKKIILIVHGGGLPSRLQNNPKKYLSVLKRATQIVCPSPFLQHEIKKYGIDSLVIENVLKLSDYQCVNKESFTPKILWMRAFSDIYNPLMAVRVLARLMKIMPTTTLIMAGKDLGNLADVKQLAKQLNVENNISYPGYVHTETKNELAKQIDIYICTNKVDNAPVTFIEMMALGIPIVSVNVGGIPYLVKDNINGLLVNLDDDEAMVSAILRIVNNSKLGKQIAKNGLNTSQQYGSEIVVAKWQSLFNKLLTKKYN